MKNKIDDLRNHLFATLEALQDKENPMEIDRAKAISKVADSIIDSARVECQYMELTGTQVSAFIAGPKQAEQPRPQQLIKAVAS